MCRELREVLRRRVRVDDASAGEAGETDVRQRGERLAVLAHSFEGGECREQTGAVVRADRGDVELGQPVGCLGRRHAGERFRALVERQQRDDRQARHAPHRLDRVDDLLEVVERLDHEQVGAATVQHRRLLGEQFAAHA